jgi:two-component system response regulator DesR
MRGIGPITQKESQVLNMLAEYRTYEYIASSMYITTATVYNHIASIMIKTGVHKKELLIKYAHEHGYGRKVAV